MKHIKMMVLDGCPYCKEAFQYIELVKKLNPIYQTITIEIIEENKEKEKTEGYDYWYVPTFFVDDVKIHEGVTKQSDIEAVYKAAIG